ncbi:MAG: LAGLIDADG family homing endonuclease [Candidatus Omnitrophota bacterium]
MYVCLPPETELILGDGSIVEIGEFVDNLISQNELKTQKLLLYCDRVVQEKISCFHGVSIFNNLVIPVEQVKQDGLKRVEIAPATGRVLSWDKNQFLPMNVICAQRKESGRSLIKITTASGQKLSLTGEHKVLIDALDGPRWQRADLLKVKDELFAPRKIWLDTENEFYLVDFLDGNIKAKISLSTKEKINQVLIKNYGSIKEAAKVIGFKYWQMKERNRLIDLVGLKKIFKASTALKWEEIREELFFFGIQGGKTMEIKDKKFTEELMYLLGLISSDGSLDNKTHAVIFINKNDSLLKEFEETYSKLFYGRKISRFVNNDGITYLTISNPILHALAERLQIKTDPKELIKLPERLIAGFIRGFFDGDGYCGITKTKHSFDAKIILSTVEEKLAKRLRLMLQRLGIACSGVGRTDRFDLVIYSKEDIKNFFNLVSSRHPKQRDAMEKIKKLWQTRESRGKFFSIAPKNCGKIIARICKEEGISITRLDKKRNICSLSAGVRRATKERFKRYREDLIKIIPQDRKNLFKELDLYLEDDFYLDPIKKIEIIPSKSKFVYDITVDNTHLFVPEGAFVISNCYDNEAYMNTGIQRSGLTPFDTNTTTSPSGARSSGNIRPKKPMPEICLAHGIPYVACASAGFPQDLTRKVKKAISIKGPKYIQVHVPCPLGWRHETNQMLAVARLAVETGLYPLFEYENCVLVNRKQIVPKPVEEYLKSQGRFKHLLNNPEEIKKIQEIADNNIKKYNLKVEA